METKLTSATLSSKLRSFAKGREKAYQIKDKLTGEKARAITNILRVSDFCKNSKGLGWVNQIKNDVQVILPHPDSRFAKQGNALIELLDKV